MKRVLRAVVVAVLGWQLRRLRRRHQFPVVAVVGSIGKTSTKFAIAQVLQQRYRVRFQAGNYNDLVTVPLVFFDQPEPSLLNPFAWLATIFAIERRLHRPLDFDVAVIELSTDGPGQIAQFARYVDCDITVVTALTAEHMEFFDDIDHVAAEELSVASYSHELIANCSLAPSRYFSVATPLTTFGLPGDNPDFAIGHIKGLKSSPNQPTADQLTFTITEQGKAWLKPQFSAVAQSEVYSATAAALVAKKLGLTDNQIEAGIAKIQPVSGRMRRLAGIHGSTIYDETYNASPEAVKAALDSLYATQAPQKIAILGNMNELGRFSAQYHTEVGEYCDSRQLQLVVTIGPDANQYLAPAAMKQGCLVRTFDDPYSAGEFVKSQLQPGAVILAKGSQNRVFAEEAVKLLLAHPSDAQQLVRQSTQWLRKKQKQFKKV